MIDVDLISHLDVRTGLPVVDSRSNARQWLESPAYGPERDDTMNAFAYEQNFGPVGAEKHKNRNERSRPTLNNKHHKMHIKHDTGLLEASELKIEDIERLLLEHGFAAQIECDWVQVKMPRWSLLFNLVEDAPAVDLAGAFELRQGVSLKKTLRLLNYLNNTDKVVKFSLWEPPHHGRIDLSDVWASVALPIHSGFSSKQFIGALDLLLSGLEYAFTAAVEAGFAEPPCATWQCGCEHEEVVGYGL
jgi:hypothetical protein